MYNEVRYQGLRIEVSLAASRELVKEGKDLWDVQQILEEGYPCGASKRKPNIMEQCLRKGRKEYKAVVAKTEIVYPDGYREAVWRLIHFGQITYKKR
ncbi:hypothetical protein HYS48_03625 [Candidatus Woesearchaeota archaeon]|nr:hypothetical protein [Candidatus Woesearchaeota archaeon]